MLTSTFSHDNKSFTISIFSFSIAINNGVLLINYIKNLIKENMKFYLKKQSI